MHYNVHYFENRLRKRFLLTEQKKSYVCNVMIFFFDRFLRYNKIYHFITFDDVTAIGVGTIGRNIARFPEQGECASLMMSNF